MLGTEPLSILYYSLLTFISAKNSVFKLGLMGALNV